MDKKIDCNKIGIGCIRLDDSRKSEFASTSVFVNKGLPEKDILLKYSDVIEEIACTSDIYGDQYGKGIICLRYDISEHKVHKRYYGTAKVLKT